MVQLYTPKSNTQQGRSYQDFLNALSAITNAPPANASDQDIERGKQAAQSLYLSTQMGQPAGEQAARRSMTEQAGIPQLQGQYGDLSKIFDLYVHDTNNLAPKYAASANLNPYASPALIASGGQPPATISGAVGQAPVPGAQPPSGTTPTAPNPYLAPTDQLAKVGQPQGTGFTGFTSPGLVTEAMAQPAAGAINIMNLITKAIGNQQDIVSGKMGDVSASYQKSLDALLGLANLFQTEQNRRTTAAGTGGIAGGRGTIGQSGAIFSDIIDKVQTERGGQATERDIYNYINQHDAALRAQGVDVDNLWKLHSDLANKVGQDGLISGGTKVGKITLDNKTMDELTASQDTLNLIQQAKDEIKNLKDKGSVLGGISAKGKQTLYDLGWHNVYNTNERHYVSALLRLQGSGDRKLMGGRLLRDLVKMFGPSFPDIYTNFDTVNNMLDSMQSQIKNDVGMIEKNKGVKTGTLLDTNVSTTGGTTVMTSPDGTQFSVPNNKVERFKQNGYK